MASSTATARLQRPFVQANGLATLRDCAACSGAVFLLSSATLNLIHGVEATGRETQQVLPEIQSGMDLGGSENAYGLHGRSPFGAHVRMAPAFRRAGPLALYWKEPLTELGLKAPMPKNANRITPTSKYDIGIRRII